MRAALEDRLKRRAADDGVPLDRLRKEAAYQRLLARLVEERLHRVVPEHAVTVHVDRVFGVDECRRHTGSSRSTTSESSCSPPPAASDRRGVECRREDGEQTEHSTLP